MPLIRSTLKWVLHIIPSKVDPTVHWLSKFDHFRAGIPSAFLYYTFSAGLWRSPDDTEFRRSAAALNAAAADASEQIAPHIKPYAQTLTEKLPNMNWAKVRDSPFHSHKRRSSCDIHFNLPFIISIERKYYLLVELCGSCFHEGHRQLWSHFRF